jgi:hypothetical protein
MPKNEQTDMWRKVQLPKLAARQRPIGRVHISAYIKRTLVREKKGRYI